MLISSGETQGGQHLFDMFWGGSEKNRGSEAVFSVIPRGDKQYTVSRLIGDLAKGDDTQQVRVYRQPLRSRRNRPKLQSSTPFKEDFELLAPISSIYKVRRTGRLQLKPVMEDAVLNIDLCATVVEKKER